MFGCQPVVHGHYFAVSLPGQGAAQVVVTVQVSEDETAAVEVEQTPSRRFGRGLVASHGKTFHVQVFDDVEVDVRFWEELLLLRHLGPGLDRRIGVECAATIAQEEQSSEVRVQPLPVDLDGGEHPS